MNFFLKIGSAFHKANNKSLICIQVLAFLLYLTFFSLLFYYLLKQNIIEAKTRWDFLCYGFLFAMVSLLIPLGRAVLWKIIKKKT